ncbi:MAG: Ig-like domain-containing protein, partial [Gemmatimonadaceae bacterium]|nr:Ig-like domain-containing protein [Gemmatimonadaceae bacterium]
ASIQVAPGADTLLAIGRTRGYTAVARAADGTALPDAPIRWRSSDTLVALVDSLSGVVTAVRNGLATISAQSGTATGSGTVSVIQIVASVTVTPAVVDLETIGGTQVFTAQARDSANVLVAGTRFLWTSSNQAVATVDSTGTATVVAGGETVISASGRGVPAYAQLTVKQVAAHLAFTIEPTDVGAGDAFATGLEVEVRDANGALVRDARVPVTLSIASGPLPSATLFGTRTVQSVAGIATFAGNWLERAATGYRLMVTSAGMVPDTTVAFAVRAGAPTALEVFGGVGSQVGFPGAPQSMAMDVKDRYGNPIDSTYSFFLSTLNPPGTLGGGVRQGATRRVGPGAFAIDSVRFARTGTFALRATLVRPGGGLSSVTGTSEPLRAIATFSSISLGRSHACGIAAGGALCWGPNRSGEFGSGVASSGDSIPALIGSVWGNEPLQQIVPLDGGTCALATSGRAYCWGSASRWPAGPIAGTGPGGAVLTSISGYFGHVCGVTALGTAHCWGDGGQGQLGNGSVTARTLTPVQVSGSGTGDLILTSISAGELHTCAIPSVGRAYCWGANFDGELGDSSTTSRVLPTRVAGSGTGARVFTSVRTAPSMTCALNTSSQVRCWGFNLRSASGPNDLVPALTIAGPASDFAIGNGHACAITSGTLSCLGRNEFGAVGPNAAFIQIAPVAIGLNGRTAQRVWAGGTATCVQTADGVYCFGRNVSGMLGIGSTAVEVVRDPTRMIH